MNFTEPIHSTIVRHWQKTLLCCLLLMTTTIVSAKLSECYTKDRPLIIVTNLNFPPYEFQNDGEPDGYHVDILKALMKRISVPYRIVMKEGYQQGYMFDHNEADLIVTTIQEKLEQHGYISRSILNYYKLKIAHSKQTPDLKTTEDLRALKSIAVGQYDYTSQEMVSANVDKPNFLFCQPADMLNELALGGHNYLIWGEEPLKWSIRKLELSDSISVCDLSFWSGEFHFACHDKELIDIIDDLYARMDQSGELYKLRIKWFFPEKARQSLPYTALFGTIMVLIFVALLLFINRNIHQKEDMALQKSDELHHMMELALSKGNYSVMIYDVVANRVSKTYGKAMPFDHFSLDDIIGHIHPDDQAKIKTIIEEQTKGKRGICEINLRWRPINGIANSGTQWDYIHGHLLPEKDINDNTRYIVCALKNVTTEHREEEKAHELTNRFIKIFDNTLVGMSFYDKEGKLIGLNDNMRRLTHYDDHGDDTFFHSTSLFDVPMFKGDFDPDSPYHLHACQHMLYPELGIDKYIEFRILPTYDKGELLYYVVTARDATEERQMYMELYQKEAELKLTNTKRNLYERQLRYLLENSQMWVWSSNIAERTLHFSRTLQTNEFTQTFDDFIKNVPQEQLAPFMNAFNNMNGFDDTINITLHMKKTPVKDEPLWVAISGIPTHDKHGKLQGHFGIVRDITHLMDTQEKLRLETTRAEDSGKLKSMFLANMTHEIRTPLNAIVGFSDLLQVIDNPEERREFMRIIRNNCDMLIRLIDDIIEASNMNQGPIAIEAADVDFAVAFNDICQTLAQRVQEPTVEFVVDNPYDTFPTHLDKGRLQQVITNFTTNAVKYTHQGHIKVGYRYEENTRSDNGEKANGIYMYCEDTGAGIPADKQKAVFERFVKLNDYVQGTGLGLSICKSIADRCGGHIGVTSEGEGKGSTFWIWIPCERKDQA